MNGTSGFEEVQSSTPDHQPIGSCTSNSINSEIGTWCLLQTHDLIAFSTGISTKREKVPKTFSASLFQTHSYALMEKRKDKSACLQS